MKIYSTTYPPMGMYLYLRSYCIKEKDLHTFKQDISHSTDIKIISDDLIVFTDTLAKFLIQKCF